MKNQKLSPWRKFQRKHYRMCCHYQCHKGWYQAIIALVIIFIPYFITEWYFYYHHMIDHLYLGIFLTLMVYGLVALLTIIFFEIYDTNNESMKQKLFPEYYPDNSSRNRDGDPYDGSDL